MPKLMVFNNVSLDGYFADVNNDMRFAQNLRPDKEWDEYIAGNASGESTFVFGRVTYDMMAGSWTSPALIEAMPKVAKAMNESPKVVFSRSRNKLDWQNSRLAKLDLLEEVRQLKQGSGNGMVIFGSGSIVAQLTEARLIDEYTFIIVPVILGAGRSQFEGVRSMPWLNFQRSRSFANGNVMLSYTLGE